MSKQWMAVLSVVAGLVLGGAALVKFGPQIEGVNVGKRAPDFTAVNLATGDSVRLRTEYADQVTLVNIWATWCIPCRTEMPAMERLYQLYGPKGFRIAAVSIDEGSVEDVRAFAKEFNLTFDILHDVTGEIQRSYQTTGVPESFLLDKDGVIVKRVYVHEWDTPANQRVIAELMGLPAPGVPAAAGEVQALGSPAPGG
jgi:cytochrome c biogenesis protein CcmG, thiol:disulfide interchange protein DsbE